jgi:hypothetical protein
MVEAVVDAVHRRTDWVGHFSVVEDGRVRQSAIPRIDS